MMAHIQMFTGRVSGENMFYGDTNLYQWKLNIIILAVNLFMCDIIHTRVY